VGDARAGVLDELQHINDQIDRAVELAGLKPLFYRLETIAQEYHGDAEVEAMAVLARQRLIAKGSRMRDQPPADAGTAEPSPIPTPFPAVAPPVVSDVIPPVVPPAQDAKPAGQPPPPPPAAAPFVWKRALITGSVIGVVLFLIGLFALSRLRDKAPEPAATGPIRVSVASVPTGAAIRVDGELRCVADCSFDLLPGTHEIEARLEGYEPLKRIIDARASEPVSLNLPLSLEAQSIRIAADMLSGEVLLDGNSTAQLQDGQALLENVQPGSHTISIAGGSASAEFALDVNPGQAPLLSGPIRTRNVLAVLVSNKGDRARLYTSSNPWKVYMGGQQVGETAPAGIDLTPPSPGDHELTIGEGSQQRKLIVNFGPAPVLAVFLKTDINAGTLVVATGEDDVQVFLNGKPQRRSTARGQLRIPGLPVREYAVRVEKEGYQASPGEQRAMVRKGEETRLEFRLQPLPRVASLRISGAAPGAQVFLEREHIGSVQPDGTFAYERIAPGKHTIEIRQQSYAPRQFAREFRAGETVELGGPELAMVKQPATLRLVLVPPDAKVTIRGAKETQERTLSQPSAELPEGSYSITATAPGHNPQSVTVQLSAGQSRTVELRLRKQEAPPAPKVLTLADWPGVWEKREEWFVRKGGDFVLFPVTPTSGTFLFTATMLKSTAIFRERHLEWVVGFKDPKNYLVFEIDNKNLSRKEVRNGRGRDLPKVPHGLNADQKVYTISIEISPGYVTHRIRRGDGWTVLDKIAEEGRDFDRGSFGFRIEGNDEVGVRNFSFQPK